MLSVRILGCNQQISRETKLRLSYNNHTEGLLRGCLENQAQEQETTVGTEKEEPLQAQWSALTSQLKTLTSLHAHSLAMYRRQENKQPWGTVGTYPRNTPIAEECETEGGIIHRMKEGKETGREGRKERERRREDRERCKNGQNKTI